MRILCPVTKITVDKSRNNTQEVKYMYIYRYVDLKCLENT